MSDDIDPARDLAQSMAFTIGSSVNRTMADLLADLTADVDPAIATERARMELLRVMGIAAMQAFGDAVAMNMRAAGQDEDDVAHITALVTEGMFGVNEDFTPPE